MDHIVHPLIGHLGAKHGEVIKPVMQFFFILLVFLFAKDVFACHQIPYDPCMVCLPTN